MAARVALGLRFRNDLQGSQLTPRLTRMRYESIGRSIGFHRMTVPVDRPMGLGNGCGDDNRTQPEHTSEAWSSDGHGYRSYRNVLDAWPGGHVSDTGERASTRLWELYPRMAHVQRPFG
eukprot:scaffold843_cov330-Pavlova_lutheri.AAC.18